MKNGTTDDYFRFLSDLCGDKSPTEPYIDCSEKDKADFESSLRSFLLPEEDSKKCILGIDIYKYSQYDSLYQKVVPFIFHHCLKYALSIFIKNEPYLSYPYNQNTFLKNNFIDTGDGGFLVFETPLDALCFLVNFAFVIRMYNTYNIFPKLRSCMGQITYRSALTYDHTYKFNSNTYGSSIINCARILSLDKLDRILFDENTAQWFTQHCTCIESIQRLQLEYLSKCIDYKNRKTELKSNIFDLCLFKIIISQKIDDITAKNTKLSIYNLYMQLTLDFFYMENENETMHSILNIGNLNIQGIEKKQI